MKTLIQIYLWFLFCIFLYFSFPKNAFCYAREGDYLSRIIGGNTHFIKHESHANNLLINSENSTNHLIFNVLDFGAKGDGVTNDTTAFKKAWEAACKAKGGVMLIPSRFTFLLQPVNFEGSNCQPNITIQIDGKINAPPNISDWLTQGEQWILFNMISKGITIKGEGVIDGYGASWWKSDDGSGLRPYAVRIENSTNITVTGITIQNSPKMHLFVVNGQNVQIYNFTVSSPFDSPNTDGIHISHVQHVDIHNSTLACGDDCVSIQSGCSDVKIYDVNCGPGHGYSIGGLGPNKQEAHVSDVAVFNSTVHDSQNGVRIKTWPGGRGTVYNVVFSNITMSNVRNPIVIDQHYCGGHKICPETDTNAVNVSNIVYKCIKGTYAYKPVSLACSKFIPCTNLKLSDIELTPTANGGAATEPYCSNAYGQVLTDTEPPLKDCVLSEEARPPAMPPKPE